jgi:DNA-binding protein H-NS
MARPKSLASLSADALFKLRDQVTAAIGEKADALKKELRSLGEDYAHVGRIAVYGKKKAGEMRAGRKHGLKGTKVAAKYRDPKTKETWSGRGAMAGWLAAHEKAGRKRDQYLIAKPAKKAKRKNGKAKAA